MSSAGPDNQASLTLHVLHTWGAMRLQRRTIGNRVGALLIAQRSKLAAVVSVARPRKSSRAQLSCWKLTARGHAATAMQ